MKGKIVAVLFGLLSAAACTAYAQIGNMVVTSGASFEPGLPSPGSMASVFCTGLEGIEATVSAQSLPLPLELAGVRVSVGGAPAPLFTVASHGAYQQINFQVPREATFMEPGGRDWRGEVVVEQGGKQGRTVVAVGVQAEFFRMPENYWYGVFQHASDYSLVTAGNPAKPGETVIGYLTGTHVTNPQVATGHPAPYEPVAEVRRYNLGFMGKDVYNVGLGTPVQPVDLTEYTRVEMLFLGLSPGSVGVAQVNFTLPATMEPGLKLVRLTREQCGPCGPGDGLLGLVRIFHSRPVLLPVGE
jgi:uncharacterized protein (TIGR03437 family)